MGPLTFKRRGVFVGAPDSIPEGEVLAVIVIEVQVMVRVMGSSVDDGFQQIGNAVVSVVNGD